MRPKYRVRHRPQVPITRRKYAIQDASTTSLAVETTVQKIIPDALTASYIYSFIQ